MADGKKKNSAPDKEQWDAIEEEYRAGIKSVRQIARENGISHTAINKHAAAAEPPWERDLSEDIDRATNIKEQKAKGKTDEEIVDKASDEQMAIRATHRKLLERARAFMESCMDDLELIGKAGGLAGEMLDQTAEKIKLAKDLGQAANKIVPLERLVNNLPGKASPEDPDGGPGKPSITNYVMFGTDPPPSSMEDNK